MTKTKGIFLPIIIFVGTVLLSAVMAVIFGNVSDQEWAFLSGMMFGLMAGGGVYIVILIVSIIKYNRSKSEYWLGSLYGYAGMIAFGFAFYLLSTLYNLIVG